MHRFSTWLLLVTVAGCEGSLQGTLARSTPAPEQEPTNPPDVVVPTPVEAKRFACDPAQTRPDLALRRLSSSEYRNTLQSLIARSGLSSTEQQKARDAIADELEALPVEERPERGFSRFDQSIQQATVIGSFRIARLLSQFVAQSSTRRGQVLGSCATDSSTSNDATCLSSFVTRFGKLALRHELTVAQRERLTALSSGSPVSATTVERVLSVLLASPSALYHVEEVEPGTTQLDAYALANRLSYHFWQTMPDDALFAAAADGSLLTDAGYRAQVERLAADPRSHASLDRFFTEWFGLDHTPNMSANVGQPDFDAFAGADVPDEELHLQMNEEVLAMARTVAKRGEPVTALLTNREQFATTAPLAALYRQRAWDGGAALEPLLDPAYQGLLTRAAFTATGATTTRPIMKGVRVRRELLCEQLRPPPDDADTTPPSVSATATTREATQAVTEIAGSACAGCHRQFLNPFGFVTENFDGLGRSRSAERIFGEDGTELASRPVRIDAEGVINELLTPLADVRDLNQAMVAHGAFQSCFARQYTRFTFARTEDEETDGCVLADLQRGALEGAPLSTLVRDVALSTAFKTRVLP